MGGLTEDSASATLPPSAASAAVQYMLSSCGGSRRLPGQSNAAPQPLVARISAVILLGAEDTDTHGVG